MRPPKSVSGCSQYTLRLESGLLLRLWGFGFFIGEGEGVYVNRYNFTPRHVVMPEDVWETKYFARAPYSQDYELFALGLRTIIKVEETVLRRAGLPYRQRCVSSLEKAFFEPYAFLAEWRALERQVTRFAQVASRHAARTQYPCRRTACLMRSRRITSTRRRGLGTPAGPAKGMVHAMGSNHAEASRKSDRNLDRVRGQPIPKPSRTTDKT